MGLVDLRSDVKPQEKCDLTITENMISWDLIADR